MKLPGFRHSGEQMMAVLKRDALSVASSVFAFAVTALLLWAKGPWTNHEEVLLSLIFAGSAGISLFLAVRLWARGRERLFGALLALAVLIAFTAWHWSAEKFVFYRWTQLFLITHLLVALTPLRGRDGRLDVSDETGLWRFNWYMLTRFLFGIAFCVPMALGLIGALWALKFLFDIQVPNELYATVFFFVFFVASVFQVLSTITDTRAGAQSETVTRDIKRLVQFVFTPLALVYFLIVYVYIAQIAVQRVWPQGVIGGLVSALTIGVFLMALLQRPLAGSDLPGWILAFWSRAFALLVIPLIVLMFAVWRRVGDYGWTHLRVTLFILCLWALALSLLHALRPRASAAWIPMSLAAVAILTLAGPLSPHALSRLSQAHELRAILEKSGAKLVDGAYRWPGPAKLEDEKRLSSILSYVCTEFGVRAAMNLAQDPQALTWKADETGYAECSADGPGLARAASFLGIQYRHRWETDKSQEPNEWFDARDEREFQYQAGPLRWGTFTFNSFDHPTGTEKQAVQVHGLKFERTCCDPRFSLLLGGRTFTVDYGPLLTREAEFIRVPTPQGLFTLWLLRGQASRPKDGAGKEALTVVGELQFSFALTPAGQIPERADAKAK